ncbi:MULTISPECIES: acyl-CoA carboxylase subunit epsilon [unclassified Streptomyces]|uniref:acyl-CoA carboxylase subunit epsilon n=1 Tax=unclassified Streptomyces TaxID=2593676 RepID=UPI0028884628|nr:acyl-CoA carboxylase subunit epsilon [Streptomyces sp. DSM 41633]
MSNDVPIASLLRVERGVAAPEELAALAVVVACYAHRNSLDRDRDQGGDRARGPAGGGVGSAAGRRRTFRPDAGCWANCWACR